MIFSRSNILQITILIERKYSYRVIDNKVSIIDTIFNNSVTAYKESLEKLGHPYTKVMEVYHKIEKNE